MAAIGLLRQAALECCLFSLFSTVRASAQAVTIHKLRKHYVQDVLLSCDVQCALAAISFMLPFVVCLVLALLIGDIEVYRGHVVFSPQQSQQ